MAGPPVWNELRTVKVVKSKTGQEVRDGVVGRGVPQGADGEALAADAAHTVCFEELVGSVGPRGRGLSGHWIRRGPGRTSLQLGAGLVR